MKKKVELHIGCATWGEFAGKSPCVTKKRSTDKTNKNCAKKNNQCLRPVVEG